MRQIELMVDEPAQRSQARVFSAGRAPDPQSALAAKLIDSSSGLKANYVFFLSCVKSVPDLPSQPGFFATGTDERLLLRGRRVTSDHLRLRCGERGGLGELGELGDGGGVSGD